MTLIAKNSAPKFPPIEAGTHQAVLYAVIDLGTQYNETYDKSQAKVMFTWELPDERIDIEKDGQSVNLPRAISNKYTCSMHEKSNLFQDITGMLGRELSHEEQAEFDLKGLVGTNCLLQIVHAEYNNKTYAKVAGVTPLMKSMTKKEPENPTLTYDIDEDGLNIPDRLPDWVKETILQSVEYKELKKGEDDLPF